MQLPVWEPALLLLISGTLLLGKFVFIIIVTALSMVIAMYVASRERRLVDFYRDKNRSNRLGILKPVTDGIKFFFRGSIVPADSNRFLFIAGSYLAVICALMMSAVIPWGDYIHLFGRYWHLQVAEINVSLLFIFALMSIAVPGMMLIGLTGKDNAGPAHVIKATTRVLTYELVMCSSLLSLVMVDATLKLDYMVYMQRDAVWNIFYQPLGFLIFFVCALVIFRQPHEAFPEAGDSVKPNLPTEPHTFKTGWFLLIKYLNLVLLSAFIVTLYFGGYDIPFVNDEAMRNSRDINWLALWESVTLLVKILGFLLLFLWVGRKFSQKNQRKILNLDWKILLPLALLNMLGTGWLILFK